MMRRKASIRHEWAPVRSTVKCSFGHDVHPPHWVRFSQVGHQRLATCDTCLRERYGLTRPNSTFSFHGDAEDFKNRQAGE